MQERLAEADRSRPAPSPRSVPDR